MLELILLPPIIAGILAFLLSKHPRAAEIVALSGASLAAIFALLATWGFIQSPVPFVDFNGLLYLDSISALFTSLTALVSVFVFLYSIGYIRNEVKEKVLDESRLGTYYG